MIYIVSSAGEIFPSEGAIFYFVGFHLSLHALQHPNFNCFHQPFLGIRTPLSKFAVL